MVCIELLWALSGCPQRYTANRPRHCNIPNSDHSFQWLVQHGCNFHTHTRPREIGEASDSEHPITESYPVCVQLQALAGGLADASLPLLRVQVPEPTRPGELCEAQGAPDSPAESLRLHGHDQQCRRTAGETTDGFARERLYGHN